MNVIFKFFWSKWFYLILAAGFGMALPTVWEFYSINPSTWNLIVVGCCFLGALIGIWQFLSKWKAKDSDEGSSDLSI